MSPANAFKLALIINYLIMNYSLLGLKRASFYSHIILFFYQLVNKPNDEFTVFKIKSLSLYNPCP